jgi:large subunit ribosomal protein L25
MPTLTLAGFFCFRYNIPMQQTQKLKLKAQARDAGTEKPAKIRKAGQIPAVLYGHKVPTQSLTVALGDFEKILKKAGESTIIELETQDGKTHSVLIHDIQKNYLTSKPEHVDFYQVSMTEKLRATVVLEFIGEAKAVKELGGVLIKILNEVEVECLPQNLPRSIMVNIASLNTFSDTIHVKDLQVPNSVKILTKTEEILAKVQPPREIEEVAEKPVEDITKVEGAAEVKPATEPTAKEAGKPETKEPETKEKEEKKEGKKEDKPKKE